MRTLRHFSLGLLIAASGAALIPATTRAQKCDYQVVSATWHPHSENSKNALTKIVNAHHHTNPARC